ncbi:MAG: FMN-binding protein [Bacteroidota bacterium]
MENTRYIIIFTLVMTSAVALMLAGLFYATETKAKQNEAIFNKRAVLKAVETYLDKSVDDMGDDEVLSLFEKQVQQKVLNMNGEEVDAAAVEAAGHKGGMAENIDMAKEKKKPEADRLLPLFTFNYENGSIQIVSVRGNGLWDEIWGNIAIELNSKTKGTVVGAAFDHKAETPGLGAEIKDNPSFRAKFKNKRLYNDDGEYVSVKVEKGGAKDEAHGVDVISGATVTSVGVGEMLYRGIKYYEPYFNQEMGASKGDMQGMLIKEN